ncbi:MAG: hypothetical protein H6773_00620 [Pseudomonadales bacterium]|nr:hypothetical protein [Pseudomonadales bacterium]
MNNPAGIIHLARLNIIRATTAPLIKKETIALAMYPPNTIHALVLQAHKEMKMGNTLQFATVETVAIVAQRIMVSTTHVFF